MRPLLLISLCFTLSSCGFSHLTDVQNQDLIGPTAKECSSCHIEQYKEWQQTAHARAFISPEFKLQSDHYKNENCLFCHSPGSVLNPEKEARVFNRDEGVTCVSCHLYEQVMQGPHMSGAVFSPHDVAKNSKLNSQMNSSQLCGICHKETYNQWQSQQKHKEYPTCHGCHGASVERASTKGDNFFTKILVALEPVHRVRSHKLMIPNQPDPEMGPELHLDTIEETIKFTLLNSLPHDLPAGNFGKKELFIILSWVDADDVVLKKKKIVYSSVLAPGEKKSFTANIPREAYSRKLFIDLFRFHQSTGETTLIRSYPFTPTMTDHKQ